MNEQKKLKICPFCGGEAEMVVAHHVFEKPYVVICKNENCRASKGNFSKTKEEAIETWNTRKPMQNIVERLEEEQEKLDTDMFARECDNWHGQLCNGISEGVEKAIEIVKEEGDIR